MSSDERDKLDRILFRQTLDELFESPQSEFGGLSRHSVLEELLREEWYRLAERSCQRNNRAIPNQEDANSAFDAIKYSITADSRKREKELPDPSELRQLTLLELNRYVLSRMRINHWIALGIAVSAIFGAGMGFSELLRRLAV